MTALMDALQGAIDIDTNIFLFINGMHNTFFDYFMSAYSGKWVWVPMYAAIWYVMLRNFHWKVTLFCIDRKSTRLNSSHIEESRMPSSA